MTVLGNSIISVFDWGSVVNGLIYCTRCGAWMSIADAYNEDGDSHVSNHIVARDLMREIGRQEN